MFAKYICLSFLTKLSHDVFEKTISPLSHSPLVRQRVINVFSPCRFLFLKFVSNLFDLIKQKQKQKQKEKKAYRLLRLYIILFDFVKIQTKFVSVLKINYIYFFHPKLTEIKQ